jgi:SAM-dependent methyltransferase
MTRQNPRASARLESERYTLPTGHRDADRLTLLDEIYAPATESLLDELALPPGSRVADLGCGTGLMSLRFAARFNAGDVTGVDISADQIGVARENAHAPLSRNVSFKVASAYETGLATAAFDLVFCRALLSHLQHPLRGLAEMRRLLKAGGTLLCEDLDSLDLATSPLTKALSEFDASVGERLGIEFNIGPRLPDLARAVGIADPKIRFFVPAFRSGRAKRFVEYTLAAHMPFLIDAGVATAEEVEMHLANLRRLNQDESQVAAQFRLTQVWGCG